MAAILLCVFAAVLIGGASAQAAPSVGVNVNVSKNGANIGEAAVAVDPTNPQHVFVSGTIGLYRYSTDGGATWNTPTTTLTNDAGDTSLSWDRFGNLFLVYLDRGVFATPKTGHVLVWLSTDGGKTFTQIATLGTGVSSGNIDQPSITTGAGEVWVCWRGADGNIQASGANVTGSGSGNVGGFSPPQAAGSGNFGDIAIGPSGAVMVTYQRNVSATTASIYTALDSDGTGAGGFASEVKVTDTNVLGFYPIPAQSARTVDAESNLAWDRSGGAHNGRVYLVYTDTPSAGSADTNIFVRYSGDNGSSWSGAVQANDDGGSNSQFLPAIAIDQTTGKLAVTWYDARNDSGSGSGDTNGIANDDAQYWGTTSNDGTSFAANFQISAGTSNAADAGSGIDYGDYSKVAYQEGIAYPVWSDNSNSTGDNPAGTLKAFDIYTATVVVSKRGTSLAYSGDTAADFNDAATLTATLDDSSTSTPIPGQTVKFTLGGQSCSATTDVSGVASCTLTPNQHPGSFTVVVDYAGDAQYTSSTTSASFTIKQEESKLTYTGATTSHYHDLFTASATLVDSDGGAPIAGKTVTFTLGGTDTCHDTTDGGGNASCKITPTQAGTPTIVASFAGDTDYKGSSDNTQSVSITPEETTMSYTGPTVILAGASGATLTAKLVEDGANDSDGDPGSPGPFPQETVTLSLGTQHCTDTTSATGTVSCTIPSVTVPLGPETVKADFAGDSFYQPSSDSAQVIVFAFPSRGAFVLGNTTAAGAGTSTVTWWGDTWAQLNVLSGGAAPSSFKGFAGVITLPTTTPPAACGSPWSTTGGNSPPPVSGIPSYMGVVVASSVTKSGSTISGNSVHILVVKVAPGYAPTPDHAGTGTIVATFC